MKHAVRFALLMSAVLMAAPGIASAESLLEKLNAATKIRKAGPISRLEER